MIIDRATIATGLALIGLSVAYLVLGLTW